MALKQMRDRLARAGREIQSAQQFLDMPEGRDTDLAVARSLSNVAASIIDAMGTVEQSLSERGGS